MSVPLLVIDDDAFIISLSSLRSPVRTVLDIQVVEGLEGELVLLPPEPIGATIADTKDVIIGVLKP